jgi:hypothetical protein
MKKHLKQILTTISLTIAAFQINGCAKETDKPVEKCRVCIARDNIEGVPVDNKEVCSDEAEDTFRAANADFTVTCE